jgi:hypothetical protein
VVFVQTFVSRFLANLLLHISGLATLDFSLDHVLAPFVHKLLPLVSCNSNNYSVFRPSDCMNRPESVGFAGKVQPTTLHFLRLHDTSCCSGDFGLDSPRG